ncbi:MAG: RNA polymerase sigma factor [Steroidobacteraceae bacterium]
MSEPRPIDINMDLAAARAGQPAAIGALILAHQRSVYSLALRMLGARDLAEDLTQEVFMQMSESLHGIESNEHLEFWLRKVATNRAIDQLRRRSRFEMTPIDDHEPMFGPVDHGDPLFQRHLEMHLAQLSPAARAVLLLRYQEDLDPTEIARTLEIPVNTVKSHLTRSLDAMRHGLAGAGREKREDKHR